MRMAGGMMKKNMLMMIFVVTLLLLLDAINGDLERFQHSTKGDGSLSLLVVGDWGRKGTYNQSQIAYQMGVVAEKMDIDFVISTGDNFYDDGLIDTVDPAFDESFRDIYTAPSLQKTWYNVLGNHDYRGDALAQLSPVLKARDSRWFCIRSFILDTEYAEFFFVDTTPFQDKYFTDPKDHVYDWRGVLPRDKYLSTLLKDVEGALEESKARWKIVVGHHTIKSASDHGNTQELVDKLLPILEANGVDLYINGHDHCLQHISSPDSPLQFLTSGGGSKAWRGVYNWSSPQEMKFFYDGQGFMTLHITHYQIALNFFDISANLIYKWATAPKPISPI